MSVRTNAPISASGAPQGVVTFLFTDIEGSTRRWESDPDVMKTALEAHDEVLRGAIEGHDGRVFKHTGDGVCSAFASPAAAVGAAVAAQLALELPVRMGIATGAATISHFADNPFSRVAYPEITTTITQLREVLGGDTYKALAAKGADMTNAAMAAYALEQIDRARAELQ
jgi:Adenylate and Guanylate cyclase catalytic domain